MSKKTHNDGVRKLRRGPLRRLTICAFAVAVGALGAGAMPISASAEMSVVRVSSDSTPSPDTATGADDSSTSAPSPTPTSSPTPSPTPIPTPISTPTPTPTPTVSAPPTGDGDGGEGADDSGTDADDPGAGADDSQSDDGLDGGLSAADQAMETQLVTTLGAAQAKLSVAKKEYTAAEHAYQVTRALYEQAKLAATSAERAAAEAKAAAQASARLFVIELSKDGGQVSGQTSSYILLQSTGGNLLQKLSAIGTLTRLSISPSKLADRARSDAVRAKTDAAEAADAQAALARFPVGARLSAMTAAKSARKTAQDAVDSTQDQIAAINDGTDLSGFDDSGFDDSGDGTLSGAVWVDPVAGPITSVFGPRPSRPAGSPLFHPGDDIGAACLTWIVAASAGTVIDTGPNAGYGNWVVIDHGGGIESVYGHIADGGTAVTVGEQVVAGQRIAEVGDTGLSTGCHLHLEVRINGVAVDPQPFFAERGVTVGS